MRAQDADFLKLMRETNQFMVPIYQRAYSWRPEECKQLWDDIVEAGSNSLVGEHFTGSIVYMDRGQGLHTSGAPALVIDG